MLGDYINMELVNTLKFKTFNPDDKNLGTGVYRFFDRENKVIYVGKSSELDKRIKNHLAGRTHTKSFIRKVKQVDYFQEPLYESLLESVLIAYYKPKYNQEVKKGWRKRRR